MQKFELLVGTTLGSAEYATDHIEEKLKEAGFETQIHLKPKLDDLSLSENTTWLICTSTHGAGDFPENIAPFSQELTDKQPDLASISYSVIALGSKSYDQFCNAGHTIDRQLAALNATKIGKTLEICAIENPIPEDAIDEWFPIYLSEWR